MSFSCTFNTVGNTLTGLYISVKVGSVFLKAGVMSANFNYFFRYTKFDLKKGCIWAKVFKNGSSKNI